MSAFAGHTARQARLELAASQAALAADDAERAVWHARRAASAMVPGGTAADAAYAQLHAIALEAEREARPELAASAWQAMRAAALESAHPWQRRQQQLELANANLARLRGFASPAAAGLQQPLVASLPRLLLSLGFVGAMSALSWFCGCAWSPGGRWQPARVIWPALGWCAGALVLCWALLHA